MLYTKVNQSRKFNKIWSISISVATLQLAQFLAAAFLQTGSSHHFIFFRPLHLSINPNSPPPPEISSLRWFSLSAASVSAHAIPLMSTYPLLVARAQSYSSSKWGYVIPAVEIKWLVRKKELIEHEKHEGNNTWIFVLICSYSASNCPATSFLSSSPLV